MGPNTYFLLAKRLRYYLIKHQFIFQYTEIYLSICTIPWNQQNFLAQFSLLFATSFPKSDRDILGMDLQRAFTCVSWCIL